MNLGRDLDDLRFAGDEYGAKDVPTRIGFPDDKSAARRGDGTGRSIAQSSARPELKPMGHGVFHFEGVGDDLRQHFVGQEPRKPRQGGSVRRGKAVLRSNRPGQRGANQLPSTVRKDHSPYQPGFQNAALSEPFTINLGLDDTALKDHEKKDTAKRPDSLTRPSISPQRQPDPSPSKPYEVIHLAKIDPLESLPEKTIKIEVKKAVGGTKDGQFEGLQATLPKAQKIHSVEAGRSDRPSPDPPLNITQKRSNLPVDSSYDGSSLAGLNITSHIKTVGKALLKPGR